MVRNPKKIQKIPWKIGYLLINIRTNRQFGFDRLWLRRFSQPLLLETEQHQSRVATAMASRCCSPPVTAGTVQGPDPAASREQNGTTAAAEPRRAVASWLAPFEPLSVEQPSVGEVGMGIETSDKNNTGLFGNRRGRNPPTP